MSAYIKTKANKTYNDLDIIYSDVTGTTNASFCTNIGVSRSYSVKLNIQDEGFQYLFNKTIKPAKGSSLYITPNCPIASADIRKNYTIKRNVDTGDYNVFTDLPLHSEFAYVGIIPNRNAVIILKYYGNRGTIAEFVDRAHRVPGYEDINIGDFEDIFYCTIGFGNIPDAYIKLFDGTLAKPAIMYTQLDMNFGLELTDDAVELVYHTGNVTTNYSENTIDKCALEIAAMNQYNWRDYQRTMFFLTNLLKFRRGSSYYDLCCATSKLNKSVKPIVTTQFSSKASSQKDHDMALRFMKKVLGLNDTKFVHYESISKRLNELNVPKWLFLEAFDAVVRITPKEYESADNTI